MRIKEPFFTFNSLFEMLSMGKTRSSVIKQAPFNSLFEMQLPRKLMAGVVAVVIFQFSI